MPDHRFFKPSKTFILEEIFDALNLSFTENNNHYETFLKNYSGISLKDTENIISPYTKIFNVNSLGLAKSQEITFCAKQDSLPQLEKTDASVCFIHSKFLSSLPQGVLPIIVSDPYNAFAKTCQLFYPDFVKGPDFDPFLKDHLSPKIHPTTKIHPTAIIGKNVEIGENTRIGPYAIIGDGVVIGKNCDVYDHVSILCTIMGDNVRIHSGARIGHPGFGFMMDQGKILDIPQLGRVMMGNNIRIGTSTTIDRGTLEDTVIGHGCRIDNLVQIGHNVHLGNGCVIVAQVGIAGSTHIGDLTMIGGQVGIADHLKIGKGVQIAAKSGIIKDIPDGQKVGGYPGVPLFDWHRQTIALSKLIKK